MKRLTTLVVLLLLSTVSQAGSITQTVPFNFALHGTNYQPYHQFDPALGVLDEVDIEVIGGAGVSVWAFQNNTAGPITFQGTLAAELNTDAGSLLMTNSFTATLQPYSALFPADLEASYDLRHAYYDSLSPWIGNGFRDPFQGVPLFTGESATVSDPSITIQTNPPSRIIRHLGPRDGHLFFRAARADVFNFAIHRHRDRRGNQICDC
jgi:hypothetical protein